MLNFKKLLNLNLTLITIGLALVANVYVYAETKNTLRVPINKNTYERIEVKHKEKQNKAGPFYIRNSSFTCNIYEINDPSEIEKTLDRWFKIRGERFFSRSWWEARLYRGSLLKLESESGRLLAMGSFHKVDRYLFSQNAESGTDDVAAIYIMENVEVLEKYRAKELSQIMIARVAEKALADPDIKDRIILFEPALKAVDEKYFDEKIGARLLHIIPDSFATPEDELSEEEEWDYRYRVLETQGAINLVKKVSNWFVPEQLELFPEEKTEIKAKDLLINIEDQKNARQNLKHGL